MTEEEEQKRIMNVPITQKEYAGRITIKEE